MPLLIKLSTVKAASFASSHTKHETLCGILILHICFHGQLATCWSNWFISMYASLTLKMPLVLPCHHKISSPVCIAENCSSLLKKFAILWTSQSLKCLLKFKLQAWDVHISAIVLSWWWTKLKISGEAISRAPTSCQLSFQKLVLFLSSTLISDRLFSSLHKALIDLHRLTHMVVWSP